jgi:hypothetical protein
VSHGANGGRDGHKNESQENAPQPGSHRVDASCTVAERERPLRTPVPSNPAVDAINAAAAPIQRDLIKGLGFESLLPKVAV